MPYSVSLTAGSTLNPPVRQLLGNLAHSTLAVYVGHKPST
jgi:hypothetical protein